MVETESLKKRRHLKALVHYRQMLGVAGKPGILPDGTQVLREAEDGDTVWVPCQYRLQGTELTFTLPEGYDFTRELVIDPFLVFSTNTGSTAERLLTG